MAESCTLIGFINGAIFLAYFIEVDLHLDTPVDCLIHFKHLRRVRELSRIALLRLYVIILGQLQFRDTVGHDLLESVLEQFVHAFEVLFKCALFLQF
jgi:hypothetical protein